jgi:hypothetical protein
MILFYMMNAVLLGYMIWRIQRIFDPAYADDYVNSRGPLIFYSVCSVILILISMITGYIVQSNFGKGLKELMDQQDEAMERISAAKKNTTLPTTHPVEMASNAAERDLDS